ncbi:MAG: PAS domain-containing protein [Deltaproteobacteria bacterium]|uniref:PAS domain-containing protein n=1 Tax=Candidatus Zymogenus saltonus TaxID=2844893 RepID=A0A9D8PRH4_9DELT|nr:PAS domain-containing protein [Candidatus Zymogenus saltonus]
MSEDKLIKVLYMEDDTGLANLIRGRLKRSGYEVDIAGDGDVGLAMFEENPYDLVLIDQNMPGKNGLEVIRILSSKNEIIPMIMITGEGDENVAVKAMKLGVNDYIVKDIQGHYIELLSVVIENVLDRYRLIAGKTNAEDNVKRLEKEKEAILNSILEQVIYLDTDFKVIWANRAAGELTGMSTKDFVGNKCHDILNLSKKTCENCPVSEILNFKKGKKVEIISSDGRIWSVNCSPVLDDEEEVEGIVEVRHDITAEKIAEKSLLDSKEMFRMLAENTKDFIYRYQLSPIKGFEYVSPSVVDVTGYNQDEFYSDSEMLIKIVDPGERDLMERNIKKPDQYNKLFTIHWVKKDGERILIEQRIAPIFNEEGNMMAIVGIARDISDRDNGNGLTAKKK